ncbi:MAG TPA: glycerophosphoryl diester phosphodiesterase membrane domain-containing protein [Sphingomicrobium sp.]
MPKLSLSRAWEETMTVLAHDGRLLLPVALALFVFPGLVLDVSMPTMVPGQLPPAGPWLAIAFVALIIWLIGQLAVIRLAMEPHVAVGEAIMRALKRVLPYILSAFLWLIPILIVGSVLSAMLQLNQDRPSVVAAVALIVLSIAGIFVTVRLMLSSPVSAAEQGGPVHILRRSWQLTHGNWWRLFAFVVLFWIGAVCLVYAVDMVAGLLVRLVAENAGPRSLGGLLVSIVSQLVSALLSVVCFVMLARIYVQLAGGGTAQASVPSSGI